MPGGVVSDSEPSGRDLAPQRWILAQRSSCRKEGHGDALGDSDGKDLSDPAPAHTVVEGECHPTAD
jgi:hypothetical protein